MSPGDEAPSRPSASAEGPMIEADERAALISLDSVTIDTRAPAPDAPAHLLARAGSGADEYALVKFAGPITASQEQALRARAQSVYTYLPHDTYLVKMSPAARDARALGALGASWSGPYHPAYKLSRAVRAVGAPGASPRAADGARMVMVQVYPDADLDRVVGRLEALTATRAVGRQRGARFSRARFLLTPAEIARLREPIAQISEVFWVDVESRRVPLNDTTVSVGQSGVDGGGATPVFDRGIHGEKQVIGVLDSGIDADSCYFRDSARGLPPVNACDGGTAVDPEQRKVMAVDFLYDGDCEGGISNADWDNFDHGTHVAGIAAGDNPVNPVAHDAGDGMAPAAKLVIQDAGFAPDPCADFPGIGCPVVDLKPLFQQAYDQGVRLHSNSWGDNEEGEVLNVYSAGSQDADEFIWQHKDFLLFFAALNSGPGKGTVGSPSTAKNVVSVGATRRGGEAESMATFSSCGPTDDGRIKPDITLPGERIISADGDLDVGTNNCGTRGFSGTSMATPAAAGLTALVRQYFTDGFYPSGVATPKDGFTPSASLLRATLINSARTMTGEAPADCQGFGRALLDDALFFPSDSRRLSVRDGDLFAQGSPKDVRVYAYNVKAGEPLKATIAWTDFPSTPAAAVHLVNDLDLVVVGPSGVFLGNEQAPGLPLPERRFDRRNTVEQVLIADPAPGVYLVAVRAFNVPVGPQPFSLAVTGNLNALQGNFAVPAGIFELPRGPSKPRANPSLSKGGERSVRCKR